MKLYKLRSINLSERLRLKYSSLMRKPRKKDDEIGVLRAQLDKETEKANEKKNQLMQNLKVATAKLVGVTV